MATPMIGLEEFLTMTSNGIPFAVHRYEDITRPGEYGQAFQWVGFIADRATVQTQTGIVGAAYLQSVLARYSSMVGSIYTITDVFGNERQNIRIISVRPIAQQAVITSTIAGLTDMLTVQWEMQDISTAYV